MGASLSGTRRRWGWAIAGAVLITILIVVLLSMSRSRAPGSGVAKASLPKPTIELAKRLAKSALDDEATLLDPTPLFQPTRWNTAEIEVKPPEASGSFQSYRVPPWLAFAESDLRLGRIDNREVLGTVVGAPKRLTSLDLPEPVAVPATPVDALTDGMPAAVSLGFGRIDHPVVPLPAHGPLVEIVAMGTGRPALSPQAMAQVLAVTAGAKPPAGRPWDSLEFLASVDPAGLAAPLTVTHRSGVEEVDAYFLNFFARTLRIGERLAPGFYRISIGP